MVEIKHIQMDQSFNPEVGFDTFKSEILQGLTSAPKKISSKYFYDPHGSELFNHITKHPDYYLTSCELEILDHAKEDITHLLEETHQPINFIEFGPGEGIKTELFLNNFQHHYLPFTYIPIDISRQYLTHIVERLEEHEPAIDLLPVHSDYLHGLEWIGHDRKGCNFVVFLGSSIGNYALSDAQQFLIQVRKRLHKNDYLLIGFDLLKDIELLLRAYNDSDGITRAFNLNLLHRLNRELDAHFDLHCFEHAPQFNETLGSMESYLISLEPQVVMIDALHTAIAFDKNELIHVEYSYKYSLDQINQLARNAGFSVMQHYFDERQYFVDSLWQVAI